MNIFGFLLVCLLLVGCEPSHTEKKQSDEQSAFGDASVIGVRDILDNPEFEQGFLAAVKADDQVEMRKLQAKAIEIGQVAGFSGQQMARLQGDNALRFMVFRARRQWFYQEFESHFLQLKPIAPLKKRFPEAQSLFAEADRLIARRDAKILAAAQILAGENGNAQAFLPAARQQWQANFSPLTE